MNPPGTVYVLPVPRGRSQSNERVDRWRPWHTHGLAGRAEPRAAAKAMTSVAGEVDDWCPVDLGRES